MVNSPQYVMYGDELYKVNKQVGDKLFLISLTERYVYEWKDPRSLFGNNTWQPVKDKKTYEDCLIANIEFCTPIDPNVVDIMRSV